MKSPCRFFLEGKCKFGSKCKYDHVRYTSLVDPPQWIYSSYSGLDMMEISPEEVRFAMMCGDTKEVLDNFWIKNYIVLCEEMDLLESDARIESVTNRYVDPRKFPDVFMAPFDTDRVLGTIHQMREQRNNVFQNKGRHAGQGGGHQRDERWSSTSSLAPLQPQAQGQYDKGYREREKNQYQGEFSGGSPQPPRNRPVYDRQEYGGGWNKDGQYGRKDTRKPRQEYDNHYKGRESEYTQRGSWGHGRNEGTSKKYIGPEEEFDIQETPSSFKGSSGANPWGNRPNQAYSKDARGHGRGADNRQNRVRAEGDEADFIEEDFEYGKIPYSYRKSNE